MRRSPAILVTLLSGLSLISCDSSKEPSGEDLMGSWSCTKSSTVISGPCVPTQKVESGTATIAESGSSTTLAFSNGFACSPAAACTLACTGSSTQLVCQNSGVADGSGGTYASTLTLALESDDEASGAGTATYTGGATCQWVVVLTLTR